MYKSNNFINLGFPNIFDLLYETPNFIEKTIKRTNIIENDDNYQIEVAIPGLSKEDIDIKVKDSIISISYEKKDDKNFIFTNSFNKEYTLPDDVSIKSITAKVENGVLLVMIPKDKKKTNERVIKID